MATLFLYTVGALLGFFVLAVMVGSIALAARAVWRCIQAHRTFRLVLPQTKVDVIGLGECVVQAICPKDGTGFERGAAVSPVGSRRSSVWLDFHQWRKLATPVLEATP